MSSSEIHNVALVGPGGRQQPVKITIIQEGIKLLKANGEPLELFPFSRVLKWLPSSNRTQNPGDESSLDVSLQTARGKQDLRMRAESPEAMKGILKEIDDTVRFLAEKAKEEATPTQTLQKAVKKTGTVLKAKPAAPPPKTPAKTPPPKTPSSKKTPAKTPSKKGAAPGSAPNTPKTKEKVKKAGLFGRMFSKKPKKAKNEFDVEVYSMNSSQSMPLMLIVNTDNVMLKHAQNKMKETFVYGKQLISCAIDQSKKNTLVLMVKRAQKDKRELLLRVKDASDLPVIAQMVDEKKAAYVALNDLEGVATSAPPPIPESVMRDLTSNAKATSSGTPSVPPTPADLKMPSLHDMPNMSPLMTGSAVKSANVETLAHEATKARSYAVRMREALFDRDRRLIALEKRLLEETALRRMRDNECMEMSGKLKAAEEELQVLRQKSRLAHALQLGGPASKDLISRHPDVLQRESMRAARVEVMRLEKERDELAFMNGRLILRLNDMQTSVGRIKKALKVEDAASRLNDAYSAADQAQKLVGDTAALLITEGTLDTPYRDKNPLHYGSVF